MNEVQKLAGIVVSPNKTFDVINERPTCVLPLALLFAFNLFTQFVVYKVIANDANFDQIAREKIEWNSKAASSNQSHSAVEQQLTTLRRERNYWYVAISCSQRCRLGTVGRRG